MKKLYALILPIAMLMSVSASAAVVTINQTGNAFSPNAVAVNVGDVIHFVWSGGTHTTTSISVPAGAATWDSPLTMANPTFDYTVTVAGTYGYWCTIHAPNMGGGFQASGGTNVENVTPANLTLSAGTDAVNNALHVNIGGSSPSLTDITLLDLTGNVVAVLLHEEIGMGDHAMKFNVAEQSRGIYFVRLEQNGKVITKRVMLN